MRLFQSADCKRGRRKGAGEKGPRQKTSKIVKKCQKVFRHFSTIFAQGKKRQKSSKSVKKYFRHFSTIFARHQFSGPFWEALIQTLCRTKKRANERKRKSAKGRVAPVRFSSVTVTVWGWKGSTGSGFRWRRFP